jgi:hypothetical protein
MLDAYSLNVCIMTTLYFAKMHLALNNIEIQHVFTLNKILNTFSFKNSTNLVISKDYLRLCV